MSAGAAPTIGVAPFYGHLKDLNVNSAVSKSLFGCSKIGLFVSAVVHIIGRFPGETSCLSLCWAVLDVVIAGARGLGLSDLEYREIVKLKTARAYPNHQQTTVA